MSTVTDTAATIRSYIQDEFLFEDDTQLTDQTALLDGILDSINIFMLVTFLEAGFDVQIDDSEIVREHFNDVRAVTRLVEEKLRQA